jgi:hypothetical protein
MKRHLVFAAVLVAALGASVLLGHHLGRRRGEAAVAAQLNAVSHSTPAPGSLTSPPPPPAPGSAAAEGPKHGPKSRDEMRQVLADLKSRMFSASGGRSGISMAFNEAAVTELLDTLSLDDVRLALSLVAELPPGMDRTGFSVALMARWGREDAAGAMEYFRTHRDEAGTFGTLWLTAVMMPWAERDPAAAARELAATLKPEDDDILQGSIGNTAFMVAEKLAQRDPAAALRHVADLPEWVRDPARSAVAKQVHDERREPFLESIKAMPEGEEKTAWQRAAATAMAPVDAAAASRWIDSLGLPEAATHDSTRAVFEKWKQHDPRAATEWAAARLPEGERAALVTSAVQDWAPREPNECGRWLGELEPGPQTDQAVAVFARTVAAKDPDSARAWADRITDPHLKAEALQALPK